MTSQRNMPEVLILSNATVFAPGDGVQEPTRVVVTTRRAGVPPPGEVVSGESTAYVRADLADAAVSAVRSDSAGSAASGTAQAAEIVSLKHQVDLLTQEKETLRAALVTAEDALTKASTAA